MSAQGKKTFDYIGQVLDGKYQILSLLGEGGMGAVYLGTHVLIRRKVAVKFLHGDLAQDSAIVQRFYQEAQAAAAIGHRNIIDVLDVGVAQSGEPYLVMEYLEGESLAALLTRVGSLPLEVACGILAPVLSALGVAHENGIVHRDLKPENIFISIQKGEDAPVIKLIDFGISKFVGSGSDNGITQTGTMLGTPAYMSPEQAKGQGDIDHRSDLFSLGVILYEMLTGSKPFAGDTYNVLLLNMMTTEPIPPKLSNPDFADDAEPIVMRALQKESDERYQTTEELLGALKRLPEYDSRQDGLIRVCSTMRGVSTAVGDLGESRTASGNESASQVLQRMIGSPPPVQTPSTPPVRRGRAGKMVIGASVFLALAALAVLAVVFYGEQSRGGPVVIPATEQSAAPAAAASGAGSREQIVRITLEQLPEDATVFVDAAEVSVNPIPLRRGEALRQIEVRRPGYKSFSVMVMPSKDQTIAVGLEPVIAPRDAESSDKKSAAARRRASRRKARRRRASKNIPEEAPAEAVDPALSQGGRGTKYSEDFEDFE